MRPVLLLVTLLAATASPAWAKPVFTSGFGFDSKLAGDNTRDKLDVLASAESSLAKDTVHIVYFNAAVSKMGISHAFIIINGWAYSVGHAPDFMPKRDTIANALRSSRPGALPTGVLEVPATRQQRFLMLRAVKRKREYNLLNALGRDANKANCVGFAYRVLREGGIKLPDLQPWQFTPQSVFKVIQRSSGGKLLGSAKGFFRSGKVPNPAGLWRFTRGMVTRGARALQHKISRRPRVRVQLAR